MYKPLPSLLTIKKSSIHGLGLFSTDYIPQDFILGISHIQNNNFDHGYIRTPLGAFYNHDAKNYNCKTMKGKFKELSILYLSTTKNIEKGKELLVCYSLYNLEGSNLTCE